MLPLAPLLVLLSVSFVPARAALAAEPNPWPERRVLVMAHGGGEHEAPTDTLFAQKLARAAGANVLELDVRRTGDGVLIMTHDETADRVTDGTGRWIDMTIDAVKHLDNAHDFRCTTNCGRYGSDPYPLRGIATELRPPPPGFSPNDFRVATIREVLEAFPDALLSLEIKGSSPADVPTAVALADLLREFGRTDDVLIASFDEGLISAFKARAPEIHTTPALREAADFYFNRIPPQGHVAFQIPPDYFGLTVSSPQFTADAHALGLAVYVFLDDPIETEAMYERLLVDGVDGIITARPTRMRELLEERGLGFRSRLDLEAEVAIASPRSVSLPLRCHPSASTPRCRAALSLDLLGLGAGRTLPSPLRIGLGAADVSRGETALTSLRLSPLASWLLFWLGPLDTRLHIDGAGLQDAVTTRTLRIEPGFPTRATPH